MMLKPGAETPAANGAAAHEMTAHLCILCFRHTQFRSWRHDHLIRETIGHPIRTRVRTGEVVPTSSDPAAAAPTARNSPADEKPCGACAGAGSGIEESDVRCQRIPRLWPLRN